MSKVSVVVALLSTLAFTNANAPTFQWWRELPTARADNDVAADAQFQAEDMEALLAFNSLNQELSEDDALDRFEIDELYLPRLNVELPELFDWSDVANTYLAANIELPSALPNFPLDRYSGASFSVASLGGGAPAGGATRSKLAGAAQSPSESDDALSNDGTAQSDDSHDVSANEVDPPVEQFAGTLPPNVLVPAATDSLIDTPPSTIVTKTPVQVPTPAPLGLFVLGLAGLRFAKRKKNGSG